MHWCWAENAFKLRKDEYYCNTPDQVYMLLHFSTRWQSKLTKRSTQQAGCSLTSSKHCRIMWSFCWNVFPLCGRRWRKRRQYDPGCRLRYRNRRKGKGLQKLLKRRLQSSAFILDQALSTSFYLCVNRKGSRRRWPQTSPSLSLSTSAASLWFMAGTATSALQHWVSSSCTEEWLSPPCRYSSNQNTDRIWFFWMRFFFKSFKAVCWCFVLDACF